VVLNRWLAGNGFESVATCLELETYGRLTGLPVITGDCVSPVLARVCGMHLGYYHVVANWGTGLVAEDPTVTLDRLYLEELPTGGTWRRCRPSRRRSSSPSSPPWRSRRTAAAAPSSAPVPRSTRAPSLHQPDRPAKRKEPDEDHRRPHHSPPWRDPRHRLARRHRPRGADEHPRRDPDRRGAHRARQLLHEPAVRPGLPPRAGAVARRRDGVRGGARQREAPPAFLLARTGRGRRAHDQRARHRSLGPHGQGPRPARLPAPRRQLPRPHQALRLDPL